MKETDKLVVPRIMAKHQIVIRQIMVMLRPVKPPQKKLVLSLLNNAVDRRDHLHKIRIRVWTGLGQMGRGSADGKATSPPPYVDCCSKLTFRTKCFAKIILFVWDIFLKFVCIILLIILVIRVCRTNNYIKLRR